MAPHQQFSEPRVRSLYVRLRRGCTKADLEQAVAALALRDPPMLYRVPFAPGELQWDVLPLEPLTPAEGWELSRKLQSAPCVDVAEPNFEANYAEPQRTEPLQKAGTEAPVAAGAATFNEDENDWSLKLVNAEAAWKLSPQGQSQGEGIVIGHPDSGYRTHPELGIGGNYRPELGWDFIEDDASLESDGGGHGLSTASVISSPDNRAPGKNTVTGVAPKATIIPFRVAKPTWFIPAPVLFNAGTERLRDAIWFAILRRVHVVSISLGWLPNDGLHTAIQHAVRENIIVIAAAGNFTGPLVIWPGQYAEVVAMAACNARKQPWSGSARGSAVDATGPGENVWTAQPDDKVEKSSGTSHATATVAGIAALWLAHHGRDNLLAKYQGQRTLADVFLTVLQASCQKWNESPNDWGAGLVDAAACLKQPLPAVAGTEAPARSRKAQADTVRDAFRAVPDTELYTRLADVLGVRPEAAAKLDESHGRELRFHALTNPAVQRKLLGTAPGASEEAALPVKTLALSQSLEAAIARLQ